jgi:hypothetical protein
LLRKGGWPKTRSWTLISKASSSGPPAVFALCAECSGSALRLRPGCIQFPGHPPSTPTPAFGDGAVRARGISRFGRDGRLSSRHPLPDVGRFT